MRYRHLLLISLLLLAGPLPASQVISPDTLSQTLLDAQAAVERADYEQAFALYQKAARWGHKGAQYVLGELYAEGKGVARDPVSAYAWLAVASEAPDRDFVKARNRIGNELTDTQKVEAERLAGELASVHGMQAVGIACKKESRIGSNIKQVNCYHRNTTPDGGLIVPGAG